jgi:predicted nucleic acid-binding protein
MFLIDTNVLSELTRKAPADKVIAWLDEVGRVSISAISLEEIYFGLAMRPLPKMQLVLEKYIEGYCTVLAVTSSIARMAGLLRGQLGRRGHVREQGDMLIAATAATHGLTLATRNVRDFAGCSVTLHNPFD